MSLLGDIDPRGEASTVEAAAGRIAERLVALGKPCSLAELRLHEDDFVWLLEWADGVSPSLVRRWLADRTTHLSQSTLTRQLAIGLLLFTAAAEVARREAAEGQLWSSVSKRFGPAKQVLFMQGQPTYEHKAAFEAVAAHFQLRNVFGLAGTQNWYVSSYLQFGFTYRGIEQLPMWLTGHPLTESIEDLLHDPSRRSPTFDKLFGDLKLYRRGMITDQALRATIAASPWVLPQWGDRLVDAALQKMSLGMGTGGVIDPDDTLPFVDAPLLEWLPGQRPTITLRLQNLATVLSDGTYHIDVNRERRGVLVADAASGTAGDTDIEMPMRASAVTVTIRQAEDGTAVRSQEVVFWEVTDDVSAYDLNSGQKVDPWREPLHSNRAYALILADDLRLSSEAPSYGVGGGHRVHYVAAGWDNLTVLLEDAILWEPLQPGAARPPQPDWIRGIDVTTVPRDGDVKVGQDLQLHVLNVTGKLRFLRFGSTPLDFTQTGSDGLSAPIVVSPQHLGSPVTVSIGIEHDGEQRIRRLALELDGSGALLLTDDGWVAMDEQTEQTVAAVESGRVKLIWRRDDRDGVPALGVMAGPTFIRRAWDGVSAIRTLPGFGSPLRIRRPYNQVDNAGMTLASSVSDPGVCEEVTINDEAIEIGLRYELEPDDDHQFVIVDARGGVHTAHCDVASDLRRWTAPLRDLTLDDVVAVAIAYRGRRIGASLLEAFDSLLQDAISGDVDAIPVAALSRWLRMPTLSPVYRNKFERLTSDQPCEVLTAWLTDQGLPTGLIHETSEEWLSAVRSFYLEEPRGGINPTAFERLWETLAQHDERDDILTPLDVLDEVSPLYFLLGVLWALDKGLALNRASIASFLWGASGSAIMAVSLDEASTVMQVDSNFLKRGVAKPVCDALYSTIREVIAADAAALAAPALVLQGWQWQNLETCLSVPAFRRYVCARVLEEAPPCHWTL